MKFFHTGKSNTKGGTTLGYELLAGNPNKMLVTFSRCSSAAESTDLFSKKKGRLICLGRLQKGMFLEVEKPAEMGKYEFFLGLVAQNDEKVKAEYGMRKHARR